VRYLGDRELAQYVERELLPGLAEDCVTEFCERFDVLLDLSAGSLERVDGIIRTPLPSASENRAPAGDADLDPDALCGAVGAYLGAVLCCTDGGRWVASFDRAMGSDGYQASRLKLYDGEVDVFLLAREALQGERSLVDAFQQLHRPAP
jgi:hypothetical protein